MFDLLMTGVGDAFSRHHWGTNFVLRHGDYLLAIDCPDSYRRALLKSGFTHKGEPLDVHHLDAMILTHLHGDHVNGLEMTACALRFGHERTLPLYTNEEAARDLWPRLSPSLHVLWDGETFHDQTLADFIDLHTVSWHTPFELGPFTITPRPTKHHLPAMAMRITDGQRTLGYSCDTAWDEDLIQWLSDADLIVHESSLGPAHTPLFKLMGLPGAVRKKMLVVHYPDELIGQEIEGLTLAQEGQSYQRLESFARRFFGALRCTAKHLLQTQALRLLVFSVRLRYHRRSLIPAAFQRHSAEPPHVRSLS